MLDYCREAGPTATLRIVAPIFSISSANIRYWKGFRVSLPIGKYTFPTQRGASRITVTIFCVSIDTVVTRAMRPIGLSW